MSTGFNYPEEGDVVKLPGKETLTGEVGRFRGELVILWDDAIWQFADEFVESRLAMDAPYIVEATS